MVQEQNGKETKNNRCFICGKLLTDTNFSDEHILLNALGGRLHSRSLLCKRCNEEIGHSVDEELANELNFFSSFLDIPRQRGKNQIIRTADEKYDLLPGGTPVLRKPIIKKEEHGHGFTLEIEARNESELRSILNGYAKQYPGFDVEKVIQNKKEKEEHVNNIQIPRGFHASLIYPSIIKTAVEFYLYCGGEHKYIEHLIPVIKGEEDSDRICRYFYPQEELFTVSQSEVYHILHVRGSSAEHILYGYVSYFGVVQCLVLLNCNYEEEDIDRSYVYNVMKKQLIDVGPNYVLSRESIQKIMDVPYIELVQSLLRRANTYMQAAGIIKFHQENDPSLNSFIEEQYKEYQGGAIDARELSIRISEKIVDLYKPWLKRGFRHYEPTL